ncbi:MAG: START domain-containing protein [Bacteroidota bacterium]
MAFSQDPGLLSDENWESEKIKSDVEVFSKSIDGFDIKAFKAIGFVDADIYAVYNVIMDIENYPKWYPDCESGEVLAQEEDTLQLRKIVFKLPWPFYKRDIINGFVTSHKRNSIYIEIYNAPDFAPEERKVVRVPKSEGYWLLTKQGDKTKITYSAVGDAPGIPAWIVNIFLFDSPIAAIDNLREMVKKAEYQYVPGWMNGE